MSDPSPIVPSPAPSSTNPYATAARVLDLASRGATSLAPMLPGTAGMIASAVAAALGFGADIAAVGGDPVEHIERVKLADVELKSMRARWSARRGR